MVRPPHDIEASPGGYAPPATFSFPPVDASQSPRSSSPDLSSSVSRRFVSPAANEAEPGPSAGASSSVGGGQGQHSFPRAAQGGAAEQPWRLSGGSPELARHSFSGSRSLLSETDPLLPQGPGTPAASARQLPHHNGNGSSRSPNCSYLRMPLVNACGAFNLDIKGMPKLKSYYNDLFHTLVNVPNARFYPLLAVVYALLFGVFAIPYYLEATSERICVPGVKNYLHAMWFSVQTSMTIGYGGDLSPDPDCVLVNSLIAIQSVCSLLVAYSLLGVVYARFASPTKRESTMLFSKTLVLNEVAGTPLISCRVANIRKHQVIDVSVRMLLAINNVLTEENESLFRFTSLPVFGGNIIFLALPCTVSHAITPHSPLHGMSLAMMERADMELIVLVEGVDASTSAKLQARHSYSAKDIKVNHRFMTMVSRLPNGRRLVDFTKFNELVAVPKVFKRPAALSRSPSSTSVQDVPMILQYPTEVTLDKHGAISGKRSAAAAHAAMAAHDGRSAHFPGHPPAHPPAAPLPQAQGRSAPAASPSGTPFWGAVAGSRESSQHSHHLQPHHFQQAQHGRDQSLGNGEESQRREFVREWQRSAEPWQESPATEARAGDRAAGEQERPPQPPPSSLRQRHARGGETGRPGSRLSFETRPVFSIGPDSPSPEVPAPEDGSERGPVGRRGLLGLEGQGSEDEEEEEGKLRERLCEDCVCVHNAYNQLELDAQHKVSAAQEAAQRWKDAAVHLAGGIQELAANNPFLQENVGMSDVLKSAETILLDEGS